MKGLWIPGYLDKTKRNEYIKSKKGSKCTSLLEAIFDKTGWDLKLEVMTEWNQSKTKRE